MNFWKKPKKKPGIDWIEPSFTPPVMLSPGEFVMSHKTYKSLYDSDLLLQQLKTHYVVDAAKTGAYKQKMQELLKQMEMPSGGWAKGGSVDVPDDLYTAIETKMIPVVQKPEYFVGFVDDVPVTRTNDTESAIWDD